MPAGVAKKKPRTTYKHVENEFLAKLRTAQDTMQKLQADARLQQHREQVLVETILQMEEVMRFRQRMTPLPQLNGGAVAERPGSTRYVSSLLAKVAPARLQEVLGWQVEEWSRFFTETTQHMSLLLDLISREDAAQAAAGTGAAAGEPAAEPSSCQAAALQQLQEAADSFVSTGAIGCIYADLIGRQVGTCNTLNHLTGQPEAPPQHHWAQVAARLRLTQEQRMQLAAGYQQFVLVRRLQKKAQCAVADLLAAHNSLNIQVQAVTKEASSSRSNSGGQNGGTIAAAPDSSGNTDAAGGPSGAAADAAGGGEPAEPDGAVGCSMAEEEDEDEGQQGGGDVLARLGQLLAMWQQSSVSLALLLFNTLTAQQLAHMAVASFPFVPRPAPVVEAAATSAHIWAEDVAEAPGGSDEQLREHTRRRTSVLQQQRGRWWEDFDAEAAAGLRLQWP